MPKHTNKSEKHNAARGGSTFIGILIGLVLGLAIALGVAWYINKLPNPFKEKPQAPLPPRVEAPAPKGAEPPPVVADKSKLTAQEMLTKGDPITLQTRKSPDGSIYLAGIYRPDKKTNLTVTYVAKVNADGKPGWMQSFNFKVEILPR